MKCRTMRHFIWVFTVCQSTHFGVSGLQRVNGKNLFLPLRLAGQTLFPYYMITMVIPLAVSVATPCFCAATVSNSEFSLTPNLDYFTPNFLILTPTFSKVPIEMYGKTPNFSGKQHFYRTIFKILVKTVTVGTYRIRANANNKLSY